MTIAALARAGGVGIETVRYYQRRGLLDMPERQDGSFRRYGDSDVRRLRFIRASQAAGFTLEQIAELIRLEATDDRARARELARERVQALDIKIAELRAARAALIRLERQCAAGSTVLCPILHAFE